VEGTWASRRGRATLPGAAADDREHGADVTLVAHSDAGSQYTSEDYTQTLNDSKVLASIGTVGDAYDNAMAESFVDTYKTELISDRVWRSRSELEHATVGWVAWFNTIRLHGSLSDIPPAEHEAIWRVARADLNASSPTDALLTLNAA
jgi:transposase InsO family protein